MTTENKAQAQLDAIKAAATEAMETKVAEITTQFETKLADMQTQLEEKAQLMADMEAKLQTPAPTIVAGGEVKFDEHALNAKLREVFTNCKEGIKDLGKVDTKALAVGGTGGESLAIDQELGRRVIERARENVAILGLVGRKSVSSTDYREMVLRGYPATAKGTENVAGASGNWTETSTQTYEQVVMKVAKQYAKPFISNEAMKDPHIDLMAHLEVLLAEEFSRYWALQVLFGNGATDNLRGILTTNRLDPVESAKDNDTRDFDYYPEIKSGAAADIGTDDKSIMDNMIDLTVALPTKYLQGSAYTMNRRTLGVLRKLRDAEQRPLIQFEASGFNLLGFGINIEDYWPDIAANAHPVVFGQLSQAYTLIDIDDEYLLDPYSADGGVLIKATSRKGEMVMHNDAVVFLKCAA